jgi:cation transport ATPase
VTGQGVTGLVEGRAVALGDQHMMRQLSVPIDAISSDGNAQRKDGHTVCLLRLTVVLPDLSA